MLLGPVYHDIVYLLAHKRLLLMFLHMPALLATIVTSAPGLACLPVTDQMTVALVLLV